MNLIKKIKTKNVLKYTLGGCVILKSGKELVVSRETLKKSKRFNFLLKLTKTALFII